MQDRRILKSYEFLFILCLTIFVLSSRYFTYDNIDDGGQAEQGLYILRIVDHGEWIVPMKWGVRPASKPPLYNWCATMVSLGTGKLNELTIKLPSVLSAIITIIVTFLFAFALTKNKFVSLISSLMLLLSYGFVRMACLARTDMMMTMFTILTLYFFYRAFYEFPEGNKRFKFVIFAGISAGLGTVTKAPISLILPALIITVSLLYHKRIKELNIKLIVAGILPWLVITMAWVVPALLTHGEQLKQIWINEMFYRTVDPQAGGVGPSKPVYFFIVVLVTKFLPWGLFLVSGIFLFIKKRFRAENNNLIFLLMWFIVGLIFFSIPKGKRPDYILPIYPAGAILTACLFYNGFNNINVRKLFVIPNLIISLLTISGAVIVAMPVLIGFNELTYKLSTMFSNPNTYENIKRTLNLMSGLSIPVLCTSLTLLFYGIANLFAVFRKKIKLSLSLHLGASLIILVIFNMVYQPIISSTKDFKPFAMRTMKIIKSPDKIAYYNVSSDALRFYTKIDKPSITYDALKKHMAMPENLAYISTQDLDEMKNQEEFSFDVLDESSTIRHNKSLILIKSKGAK